MNLEKVHKLDVGRKDFPIIVLLFLIDICLTMYGIVYAGGSEMSPFFRPFTSSIYGMLVGSAVYIGILAILNKVLSGRVRRILASVGISMHFSGILSWIALLAGISFTSSLLYINYIVIGLTTALAFSELERRGWTY